MIILEILIAFILGVLIGSFLNVVIYRLPISILTNSAINLNNPKRSFCPFCKHKIGALELIPILSYLAQKGKCKHCNSAISWQYPSIEIITAFSSALIVYAFGATIESVFFLVLAWFLIPLFVIDVKEQLLPDALTVPLVWIGLIYQMQFGDLQSGVIGAMLGYLFLWSIYWIFKLIRKKESMGYGDFKLFAALGAWAGWQALLEVLFIASVLSVVFFIVTKSDKHQKTSFGPFLIIAFLLSANAYFPQFLF